MHLTPPPLLECLYTCQNLYLKYKSHSYCQMTNVFAHICFITSSIEPSPSFSLVQCWVYRYQLEIGDYYQLDEHKWQHMQQSLAIRDVSCESWNIEIWNRNKKLHFKALLYKYSFIKLIKINNFVKSFKKLVKQKLLTIMTQNFVFLHILTQHRKRF